MRPAKYAVLTHPRKSGEFIFAIDIPHPLQCLSASSVLEELSGRCWQSLSSVVLPTLLPALGKVFSGACLVMCCPAVKVQNTILVGIDRQSGGDYLCSPFLLSNTRRKNAYACRYCTILTGAKSDRCRKYERRKKNVNLLDLPSFAHGFDRQMRNNYCSGVQASINAAGDRIADTPC